jgi:hypothetical protein
MLRLPFHGTFSLTWAREWRVFLQKELVCFSSFLPQRNQLEGQMDSRLFFTIVAALGALYGIAFVLFPSASLALYGMSGTSAALMTQFFGAALLSVGAIAWYGRDFKDWGAVRGVLIGGLVGYVVGLLVTLWGLSQSLLNSMGWSSAAVYVLLIIGTVWCLRGKTA